MMVLQYVTKCEVYWWIKSFSRLETPPR